MPTPGVGEGDGLGVAVGAGVGLGVAVGDGEGEGVGVGVGEGVDEAATEKLSDVAKAKPLESQARMVSACFPAGSDSAAVSVADLLLAFCTESTYMIMAVTGCTVSSAAAENSTGEATVAPLAGEQILTVLSVVAAQLCAQAVRPAPASMVISRANKNVRENFTGQTSRWIKSNQ